MTLALEQRQDLYAELSLRIRLVETRNVVFLMTQGWELCRTVTRRGVKTLWYVINWLGVRFEISRVTACQLTNHWVKILDQRDDLIYYELLLEGRRYAKNS